VTRFFNRPVAIAGAVAVGCAAIAAGCSSFSGQRVKPFDDEDRSQIIVRGGSAIFDDGTGSNARPWKGGNPNNPRDKKKWQPDQPGGAKVSAYAVTVQQPPNAAGTPSTPCPTLPLVGQVVTLEYTVDPNVVPPKTEQFTFSIVTANNPSGKPEPLLSSSVDLDQSSSTPSQLTYDPNMGWLSKVTIGGSDPSAPSQSCSFDNPNSTSTPKAVVAIQPLK